MKESLLTGIFWDAGLFLVLAAIVVPVLRYFKVPYALGYLLAGVALGPYALGAFAEHYPLLNAISLQDAAHVKILAELGIVLLLFVIGLEMTPRRLWQMRHLVFGLGCTQVLISAVIIGSIAYLWGNSLEVSTLLGLSLALSSTAIVMQWLQEQKLFVTHTGRAGFSILLLQDLAVIPILMFVTVLGSDIDGPVSQFVALTLLKMLITVLAIYFVGRVVLRPLFIFANRHGGGEVFMALSLLVIVVCASVASYAGLSMALGAFIAGVLLADTQYRHEIGSMIMPFKSMLLGIFFMSFGMSIDLYFIFEKPFWLFASVFGLMSIKAAIIFAVCKALKQSTSVAAETAILLAQAGEFGLLVVGSALAIGLMPQESAQFMLIMIGLTMIASPLIAPVARKVGMYFEQKQTVPIGREISKGKDNHVVIFGYGRMGQAIANLLSEEGVEILAFDNNVDHVQSGYKHGKPVYFGDATKKHTVQAANLEDAKCVIVAIDDTKAAKKIVSSIRDQSAELPIIVRAATEEDLENFQKNEFVHAISEHSHVSSTISQLALDLFIPLSINDKGSYGS